VSVLALVLAAAAAQAQPPSFATAVEGVYVDVFVSDAGRPVVDLAAASFELRDDGVRRPFELVAVESLPLASFLVFDTSGSVSGAKLEELRAAAGLLLGGLRPGDEVALVTFNHELRLLVPPTTDPSLLERGLAQIRPGGETAVFDALYAGAMLGSGRGRSLLVLFTDGDDTLSWLDAGQVMPVLLESNVLVQVVGLVQQRDVPYDHAFLQRFYDPKNPFFDPDSRSAASGKPSWPETPHVRRLRRLAEATGGRFWPASAPDRLADAFRAVAEAMRTRYVLRFEPGPGQREGLHELEVKLVGRKGTVHCRKAYRTTRQAGW